ncbi:dihydropteroate synthase [Lignipirellula cremea]|uniref:Dihydropteroate synthase n=1 Tax=Lignipirellula cremea TaxID=2528010 RepID=A0A518DSX4_9BACT|nr:dihydropteroate synthase [Lignipirellula cremea]QDU94908.1 Dihydropteroate synthase [Lignipirellula cremea]
MSKMHPRPPAPARPQPAPFWQLRSRSLEFGRLPVLMGIVNVTPDSFSDGGKFYDSSAAVDQALQLAADGALIVDIGGESTRPYAEPVPLDEELRRVIPVVEAVCQQASVIVSIDTLKPEVARQAMLAGAEIINDVSGLRDPAMVAVALETGAGVCVMHMQGTPATMQDNPQYDDVVAEVGSWLAARRGELIEAGLQAERICLDPGIGFGKTNPQSIALLNSCGEFHAAGAPLLVGHSRKGFIGQAIGDKTVDRTPGVIGVALALARRGVQVLRVHDPAPLQQALLLFDIAGGLDD